MAVFVNSGPRDAVPGALRAGWLAEQVPWTTFFVLTTLAAAPGLLLLLLLMRRYQPPAD